MKRIAVGVAIIYFVAMAAATTFPGLALANRIRPFVLGLPFVFAWFVFWIVGALVVLSFLYWAGER